jgi:hypothetical protein
MTRVCRYLIEDRCGATMNCMADNDKECPKTRLKRKIGPRCWSVKMIIKELKNEKKPSCFGCYGSRICVNRTTPPDNCDWEKRCYNMNPLKMER